MHNESISVLHLFQSALTLHQQGQLNDAQALYQQILQREPRHAEAWHLFGVSALQQNDYPAAIDAITQAIGIDPAPATPRANLGHALHQSGRYEAALTSVELALLREPEHRDALGIRGNILLSLGRLDEALADYDRLLLLQPEHLNTLHNRGTALHQLARFEEALTCMEYALQLQPDYFFALTSGGNILQALQRYAAAIDFYDRALQVQPEQAETHFNRSVALTMLGHTEAALAGYQRTLQLAPEHSGALNNLGLALIDLQHSEAALACFERLLQCVPEHTHAAAQALHLRQQLCLWDGLAERSAALRTALAQGAHDIPPFIFLTQATSSAEQQHCARQWARGKLPAPPHRAASGVPRDPQRRLRIAYLSYDLHEHATAHLMAGVFEAHQQQQLDCYAYSYGPHDGSALRRRLQAAFTRFEDISALSNQAAAAKIAADGIDILIDLKGYTSHERSAILGWRAAPVQVQFLGYPGTMGSPLIDYLIADRFIIPPPAFAYYDEKIVYMPDSYQPNDPQRRIGPIPSRLEAGLPATGFVFCSFNRSYKITPAVFDQWLRLLHAVPGSVLWLLSAGATVSANLRREAQRRGVDGARLIFAPTQPPAAHLARLTLADLFLDTSPVNAHTGASDALWAGVPLLTCPGATFASRVAGSLLHALDLPELIASSGPEYERIACALASQPAQLAALKRKLAAARSSSTLFDARCFAGHLETAYHMMWQRHQDGQPPAQITLG